MKGVNKAAYFGTRNSEPFISLRVENVDNVDVEKIIKEIEDTFRGTILSIDVNRIMGEITIPSDFNNPKTPQEKAKKLSETMVKLLKAEWLLYEPPSSE